MQIVGNDKIKGVSLLRQGDTFAISAEESLDFLLKQHFPLHLPLREEEQLSEEVGKFMNSDRSEEILQYFQVWRVKAATASFQPMKAAGPDDLKPIVLQHIGDEALAKITNFFKRSLMSSFIPKRWRQMKVVFIPKLGKDDYSVPKAYRPITLSNFLLKVMERVINWFLSERVIALPLPNQHAYTRGLGTETALSSFADLVENAFHRGKKSLVVSLDCSGAFNRIKFSAKEALDAAGAPAMIAGWYNKVLTDRLVSADLQGAHNTIIPTMGSPQGRILSPLVWNLGMNSLLSTFPREGVKAIGYADDMILIVNGDDPITMASLMERALRRVCELGDYHGLTFNPDKTTTVMFHRGRKRDYSPELHMGGRKLQYTDKLTYLGITFSKRLSWTDHIKSRVRKSTYLLNKTKNLVGKEWGLNPARALWIFKAIIRPKLTYGCHCLVWSHSLNQTNNNLLNRVQKLGLMGASHSLRSTPLAALEVILGILPIRLHINALAEAARFRTRPLLWDRWDGVGDKRENGLRRSLDDRLDQHCPIQFPTDVGSQNNNWVQNDCVQHPRVQIFTDASKKGKNTGYAFLASRGDVAIKEGGGALGDVSVFQAEVVAIQAALLWLISNPHKLKGTKVKLWTASQSALQSIFSLKPTSRLVEETIELLVSAKLICQIELAWV